MSKNQKQTSDVKKKPPFLPCLLVIFLAVCAVYANSMRGHFLWDDDMLIKENAHIKHWSYAPKLFTQDIAAGSLAKTSNYYRPLQMLTFMSDYAFWKLNVIGYHLSNIAWHGAAACAFFIFLYALFGQIPLCLFASLLFAVHPIHTEAVAYISGRADPMALFFLLLAFAGYLKALRAPAVRYYLLVFLGFTAALLSRESSLIFPILLLIYHYSFREKIRPVLFGAVSGTAVLYIVLRLTVLRQFLFGTSFDMPLVQRLWGFFAAISHYIRLLLWPFGLHMEYGMRIFPWADVGAITGLLVTIGLLAYAWRSRHLHLAATFSILWFFACLLPVSNIYPVSTYFSEHWLYVPSIGFFLMLGQGLVALTKKSRPLGMTGLLVILVFFSFLTIRQNGYWRDPQVFYERTLRYVPGSPRALNNLGIVYESQGRLQDAAACFNKVIFSNSSDRMQDSGTTDMILVKAYTNLANIDVSLKKYQEAVVLYNKVIELNPASAEAYNNIGNVNNETGNFDAAIGFYEKAIALNPAYTDAFNNLAATCESLGRYDEAISAYRRAIELNPDRYAIYNNLGKAYQGAGKLDKAIEAFKGALAIKPDCADAYSNLGIAYSAKGMPEEAVTALKKAIKADPRCAIAYQNLAVLYYQQGRMREAIQVVDKAVGTGCRIDPQLIKQLEAAQGKAT